jgi:hypothetical protein
MGVSTNNADASSPIIDSPRGHSTAAPMIVASIATPTATQIHRTARAEISGRTSW